MITCLPCSGIEWKHRTSSALHVFSKVEYKIVLKSIVKTIIKSFQILFSYINISTQSTITHIYPMAKHLVLKNYKQFKNTKECRIIP